MDSHNNGVGLGRTTPGPTVRERALGLEKCRSDVKDAVDRGDTRYLDREDIDQDDQSDTMLLLPTDKPQRRVTDDKRAVALSKIVRHVLRTYGINFASDLPCTVIR
jgi:hypothetical protein